MTFCPGEWCSRVVRGRDLLGIREVSIKSGGTELSEAFFSSCGVVTCSRRFLFTRICSWLSVRGVVGLLAGFEEFGELLDDLPFLLSSFPMVKVGFSAPSDSRRL